MDGHLCPMHWRVLRNLCCSEIASSLVCLDFWNSTHYSHSCKWWYDWLDSFQAIAHQSRLCSGESGKSMKVQHAWWKRNFHNRDKSYAGEEDTLENKPAYFTFALGARTTAIPRRTCSDLVNWNRYTQCPTKGPQTEDHKKTQAAAGLFYYMWYNSACITWSSPHREPFDFNWHSGVASLSGPFPGTIQWGGEDTLLTFKTPEETG